MIYGTARAGGYPHARGRVRRNAGARLSRVAWAGEDERATAGTYSTTAGWSVRGHPGAPAGGSPAGRQARKSVREGQHDPW